MYQFFEYTAIIIVGSAQYTGMLPLFLRRALAVAAIRSNSFVDGMTIYKPIVVGLHGGGDVKNMVIDTSTVLFSESMGMRVDPASLFEAQLNVCPETWGQYGQAGLLAACSKVGKSWGLCMRASFIGRYLW